MFYIVAILICLSILGMTIGIFMNYKTNVKLKPDGEYIGDTLGYCFGIHNLCYVGLVLLQICTMLQITIGLKRTYDGTDTLSTHRARKKLIILYISCLFVFLLTSMIEIFN